MQFRKVFSLILTLAMLLPTLFGCTPTTSPDSPTPSSTPESKTVRILFVGNSYTNIMVPDLFEEFAIAAGYDVEIFSVVKNSWSLTQFADPQDTGGGRLENMLSGKNQFDYVVLQEKSIRPALDEELSLFYSAVRNLTARIEAKGAQTILYSTWGRKTGSTALTDNNLTNESMTWKVAASYQAIGKELGLPVAYVGLAFYDVYTNQSKIDVYDPDKTHPSYAGNYLSAATLFATIFQVDPTTVPFIGKLTEAEATYLREAARKAVFETPEIPDQYKTTSNGIGT